MNVVSTLRRKVRTAGKLCAQVAQSARSEGLGAAAAFCVRKATAIVNEKAHGQRVPGARVSAGFDQKFGVDTTGLIQMSEMTIDSPNYLYATVYKASDPIRFEEIVNKASIQHKNFTFVDLGSGKGLTLLLASKFPFRAIRGVEFAQELHQVAQSNIKAFHSSERRCHDVASLCADAAQFEFPREPLFVYLYHPFEEELMSRVIDRLEQSYHAQPRPVIVAYLQPVLADLWARKPFLKLRHREEMVHRDGLAVAGFALFQSVEVVA